MIDLDTLTDDQAKVLDGLILAQMRESMPAEISDEEIIAEVRQFIRDGLVEVAGDGDGFLLQTTPMGDDVGAALFDDREGE